ncbi:MAG: hypothetical protein HFE36_04025 [Clostridia bacterium]|nr:hypothetical protein [Clostridia bacterium]
MRKKRIRPKITHVTADGKTMTDAEFMLEKFTVNAEDNRDFHVKCERELRRVKLQEEKKSRG